MAATAARGASRRLGGEHPGNGDHGPQHATRVDDFLSLFRCHIPARRAPSGPTAVDADRPRGRSASRGGGQAAGAAAKPAARRRPRRLPRSRRPSWTSRTGRSRTASTCCSSPITRRRSRPCRSSITSDPRTSAIGIRGVAHMFEHMMFKGSAHVAPEEHARLLKEVGGHVNAFTTEDVTGVPRHGAALVRRIRAGARGGAHAPAQADSADGRLRAARRRGREAAAHRQRSGRQGDRKVPRARLRQAPLQLDADRDDRGSREGHARRLPALLRRLLPAQQRDADRRRRRRRDGGAQAGRPALRRDPPRPGAGPRHRRGAAADVRAARRRCTSRCRSPSSSAATTSRAPPIRTSRRWRCWRPFCRRANRRACTSAWCGASIWRSPPAG